MVRATGWLIIVALALAAGCTTPPVAPEQPHWGEPYADVPVPEEYRPYHTPPFKRQDGAEGRRVFGTYAYRSPGPELEEPHRVVGWYKAMMPAYGWEFQTEDEGSAPGHMRIRFRKGDDQLVLRLHPDQNVRGTERYSVLVVAMNPPYE
jgi:hypothetical protein